MRQFLVGMQITPYITPEEHSPLKVVEVILHQLKASQALAVANSIEVIDLTDVFAALHCESSDASATNKSDSNSRRKQSFYRKTKKPPRL